MMNYLSVHQYLQLEVNSRDHPCDIYLRLVYFHPFYMQYIVKKPIRKTFTKVFELPVFIKEYLVFEIHAVVYKQHSTKAKCK